MKRIVREAAYQRALHPPKTRVSAEEFEQIVYDAIYRNRAHTSPAAIQRWAKRVFEIKLAPRVKSAGGAQ
jgi:hypothetical protein